MLKDEKDISKIVEGNTCLSCGTCEAVCPRGAISHKKTLKGYKFVVDQNKCNDCGLCMEVCPGASVNFRELNKFVFNKLPKNMLLGNFKNCYVAYSKDKKIRYRASSGGVVSTFLIYLLEKKIVDGCLVTAMDSRKPLEPKIIIARTREQVLSAMGSKYLPVPLNTGIREILKTKNERFAVVGLPCHIEGIRKMQMLNPRLKEKIHLCLGLFCGKTVSFAGTKFILKYWGIKESDVEEIAYRGKGWPGQMTVKMKEGNDVSCTYFKYFEFFNLGFFVPSRCFLCMDNTSELSDISFGDAWLSDVISKDKIGSNIVVTRTKKGEELFNQAQDFIANNKVDPKKIAKSMQGFFSKKQSYYLISNFAKIFGLGIPRYNIQYEKKINLINFVTLIFFINSIISNKFYKLFIKIPRLFWKIYLGIYESSYSIFSKLRRKRKV